MWNIIKKSWSSQILFRSKIRLHWIIPQISSKLWQRKIMTGILIALVWSQMWTLKTEGSLTRIAVSVEHKIFMWLINFKQKIARNYWMQIQEMFFFLTYMTYIHPIGLSSLFLNSQPWRTQKILLLILTWNSELHWLLRCIFLLWIWITTDTSRFFKIRDISKEYLIMKWNDLLKLFWLKTR